MKRKFGEVIREFRKSKKISQRELARKVGVDFSYISKLENGRLPPPSADTIVKICEVLEVHPDELLAITKKVPTDVKEMISSSAAALKFIRNAQSMNLTASDWEKLTKKLKNLR